MTYLLFSLPLRTDSPLWISIRSSLTPDILAVNLHSQSSRSTLSPLRTSATMSTSASSVWTFPSSPLTTVPPEVTGTVPHHLPIHLHG